LNIASTVFELGRASYSIFLRIAIVGGVLFGVLAMFFGFVVFRAVLSRAWPAPTLDLCSFGRACYLTSEQAGLDHHYW
jgi:hypothetical protein